MFLQIDSESENPKNTQQMFLKFYFCMLHVGFFFLKTINWNVRNMAKYRI